MNKYPYKTDVAVILLFYTRKETLQKTFDIIRQCRPSHLFLYQDGPRNEEDKTKIEQCRKVVEDSQIDWECDVQRLYQVENSGAWASNYRAQKWGFSLNDKCIFIEDDSTPSLTFIPFCKEMLDRYENDERIAMVSGFNFEEISKDCPYDYFFSSVFSIWGWASWRRVVNQWDENYSIVDDSYNFKKLEDLSKSRGYRLYFIKALRKHKEQGNPIYETIFWSRNILNSSLAIFPSCNMICNSGISDDAAHFRGELRTIPKRLRGVLTMKSYDLEFPLKHPKYVIEDVAYMNKVHRIMGWGRYSWIKVLRSFEELFYNLREGNIRRIFEALLFRIKKTIGLVGYN